MARDRAFRKHQDARAKARARERIRTRDYLGARSSSPAAVGFHATTPADCSCVMCGNPRKWFGAKTLQEERADEAMRGER